MRKLHPFFSCYLRHRGTLWHWSHWLAVFALAVNVTACADASRWQCLYPPVGPKAVSLQVFKVTHWHCSLRLQLNLMYSNPFCLTICITSFQFAFELCTIFFLSCVTFVSDSRLHFFLHPFCVWNRPVLTSLRYAVSNIADCRCVARMNVLLDGCG